MKLRTHLLLFVVFFALTVNRVVGTFGNTAPDITDLLEVHNIAFNLAHGRGYRFDWDDLQWRQMLHPPRGPHDLDFILARRSSHPTMFRPPLTPLLVAALIKCFPQQSFAAWRTFDCAAFSAAACLLCDLAYIGGSFVGLGTMVILLLFDPLLQIFVPGCWTEGVAFDLLSGILWLAVNARRIPAKWLTSLAGIGVGVLCLDRAVFVLMIVPVSAALAMVQGGEPRLRGNRYVRKQAALILMICLLVQLPWWARNIAVSRRFLPLGTQGGFNLPDQYGDVALSHGSWTGMGMAVAWTPLSVKDSDINTPAGFTAEQVADLAPGNRRVQALLTATFCTSLESEIAVNDRGVQAARAWIRQHYVQIPTLMLMKAQALISYFHPLVIRSVLLSVLACVLLPSTRRMLKMCFILVVFYVLAIAITHVVLARFLVPILPMFFIGTALGAAAIVRLIANFIRTANLRRQRGTKKLNGQSE